MADPQCVTVGSLVVCRFLLLVFMVSLSLDTTLFLLVILNYLIASTCLTNSEEKLPPTAASSKDQTWVSVFRYSIQGAFPALLRNE